MNPVKTSRGFWFPDGNAEFANYFFLVSSSEPAVSAEMLREKGVPYYHSSRSPYHFLVNPQPFIGKHTDADLMSLGLSHVLVSKDTLWSIARQSINTLRVFSIGLCPDDDWEDLKEAEEVENDFYDLWFAGKLDEAIARVEESWVGFGSVDLMTGTGHIISIHENGLFVVTASDHPDDATSGAVDEIISIIVNFDGRKG